MTFHIRTATPEDLSRCAAIEATCFPPEQAATAESIRQRLAAYPDHILVGEVAGEVVGYIMGPVIDQRYIADEMFADVSCHRPDGPYQSVFSLCVIPPLQRRGYGGQLIHAMMALARKEGRQGITLTCLEKKVPFYRGFGFQDHGIAASVHGGVTWHNMVLPL